MNQYLRPVSVHQVPASLNPNRSLAFLKVVRDSMAPKRPRVVLDCSQLKQMDAPLLHLLMCCLEEAMRRNGDLRLAHLHARVDAVMRHAKFTQLFEIFPTTAAAVSSYASPFGGPAAAHVPVQANAEGTAA